MKINQLEYNRSLESSKQNAEVLETIRQCAEIQYASFAPQDRKKNVSECISELHSYITHYNNTFLVAKDQKNDVVGYLIYEKIYQAGRVKECQAICFAVLPGHRGEGVAKRLILAAAKREKAAIQSGAIFRLECRPTNESLYRKFGFATLKEPSHEKYGSGAPLLHMVLNPPALPQIVARLIQEEKKEEKEIKSQHKEKLQKDEIDLLLEFCCTVEEHTRYVYEGLLGFLRSTFRSKNKEHALQIIKKELVNLKENPDQINNCTSTADILRAIVYNALVIRGLNPLAKTITGQEIVNILKNNKKFTALKEYISGESTLSYDQLVEFAGETIQPHGTDLNRFSAYCHFAKMKSSRPYSAILPAWALPIAGMLSGAGIATQLWLPETTSFGITNPAWIISVQIAGIGLSAYLAHLLWDQFQQIYHRYLSLHPSISSSVKGAVLAALLVSPLFIIVWNPLIQPHDIGSSATAILGGIDAALIVLVAISGALYASFVDRYEKNHSSSDRLRSYWASPLMAATFCGLFISPFVVAECFPLVLSWVQQDASPPITGFMEAGLLFSIILATASLGMLLGTISCAGNHARGGQWTCFFAPKITLQKPEFNGSSHSPLTDAKYV